MICPQIDASYLDVPCAFLLLHSSAQVGTTNGTMVTQYGNACLFTLLSLTANEITSR